MKLQFILGLSIATISLNAQFVGIRTSEQAKIIITPTTHLQTNGGISNDGLVLNKGNAAFEGLTADKVSSGGASQFINILNEPNNFAQNSNFTYGQTKISGIPQEKISGVLTSQHKNVAHGAYQQFAIPFSKKSIRDLGNDLNKTFSVERWSQNEVLFYDNAKVVFHHFNSLDHKTDLAYGYYILGNKQHIDLQTATKKIKGIPYAEQSKLTLQNAGTNIDFGTGGTNINQYREKYNTYVQDGFELQLGGAAWKNNYGKNLYQLGNPFLINLDLSLLLEKGSANYIPNLYGIRLEQAPGSIHYDENSGGGAGSFRYVTMNAGRTVPVGDVEWLIIRPFSVFTLKLKDNSVQHLDLNALRTFGYEPSLTTLRNTAKGKDRVRQLAVIAKNAAGDEIGRTYYVVADNANTGHSENNTMQVSASSNHIIGTYEELPNGGLDIDYSGKYWLYINEANAIDFEGKECPIAFYSDKIKSLDFELRENGEKVESLSNGEKFYFGEGNNYVEALPGKKVNLPKGNGVMKYIVFGLPKNGNLSTQSANGINRTKIVYNSFADRFVVIFDPRWKKADITIYDMSGRIIYSRKSVSAYSEFILELPKQNQAYIVTAVSESGEKTQTKIIY